MSATLSTHLAVRTPAHGERRDHGERTVHGPSRTFYTPDGQVAYEGPTSSHTFSASERYCAHCGKWVTTNGVMGALTFVATHDVGDCDKDREAPAAEVNDA